MDSCTALLVIDAQQGLLDGKDAVPAAADLIRHLVHLIAAARLAGAPVIYLQQDGAPGAPDEPNTPGWFIHPAVAPVPGETVLRKTHDDGFDGTPLAPMLAALGNPRIAVAGLLSEMCVSATIRGALARRLSVVLVQDAHGTYDLDDIPAATVARVAAHALGDRVIHQATHAIVFARPSSEPSAYHAIG